MIRQMISMSLMTLVLGFGALQLAVPRAEAANPACFACCPPSNGSGYLYDCDGPYSSPFGDVVGCAYTDGYQYGPMELYICGQTLP